MTVYLHCKNLWLQLLSLVASLSDAVRGVSLLSDVQTSRCTNELVRILQLLEHWVDQTPPHSQKQRFGNTAFREWHEHVRKHSQEFIASCLLPLSSDQSLACESASTKRAQAAVELEPYFLDAFGNATRIDYGTGHEAHFACFLLCLVKLSCLSEDVYAAVVNHVFRQYLRLMRKLQVTYWLEPAGSHGVWGLDDHQFLPFIFGASQLIGSSVIRPKSALSSEMLEYYAQEYMFLGCVLFASQIKKGPLQETSPVLCDVCRLSSWQRVCSNLFRMYKGEVLGKYPIMQHFLFGSLLTLQPSHSSESSHTPEEKTKETQHRTCTDDGTQGVHTNG